ncbi:MAG: PIG-L family deacetylase, partial [Terrimonas ferruginea]|uniref:PIG-L deacetylase family protein n=1 Tax=Terrimonas ferruginea TaxID=249 RepID=UPI001ACDE153
MAATIESGTALAIFEGARVLALGPHIDDIEIGCGGTLLRLTQECSAEVHTAIFSDHYEFPNHLNRQSEAASAERLFGYTSQTILRHKDTAFPVAIEDIQKEMRELRESVTPTLVLAPNPHDTHQDHRVVAEAARREFRYGEILWHYEVNQFGTENRFQPNIFVDLSGAYPAPAKLREVTIPDFPPHLLEGDLSFAHAKVVFTVAA